MKRFKKTENGILIPTERSHDFNYSDGYESEVYILDVLKKVKDRSSLSDELQAYIKDWPTRYHFCKERANILRSLEYLLAPQSLVLEVGSGCGAITRYLAERFKMVDAIEGSYSRARITRERVSDLSNVNVMCVNIQDLTIKNKYDIVCVIGVLEYAGKFWRGKENPYLYFLKHINNLLKNDGYLVLAIENRLGLKYWTGCAEDHTGELLEGILGYPLNKGTRTFSKKEITDLFYMAGFKEILFLYPFPDYKMTNVVLSQKLVDNASKLNVSNLFVSPFEDYSNNRLYFINELLLMRSIISASLLEEFSNSFLLIARKDSHIQKPPFLFKNYTSQRKNNYITITTALEDNTGSIIVKKERVFPSLPFDDDIHQALNISPYHNGELLVLHIVKDMYSNNPKDVLKIYLNKIYHMLMDKFFTGEYDGNGYALVGGEAVDFISGNLMNIDNTFIYIDDEWKFRDKLPVDYILFRNLLYLFRICLYTANKIDTPEEIIVYLIRSIVPNYNTERLEHNIYLENILQEKISNKKTDIKEWLHWVYNQKCYTVLDLMKIFEENNCLKKQLRQKDEQVNSILNSRSWKITAPLRWVRTKVKVILIFPIAVFVLVSWTILLLAMVVPFGKEKH